MTTRSATSADFDGLAIIWHDGWHDGHAQVVPVEMRRWRNMQNFRDRVTDAEREMRVSGEAGAPRGFYIVKEDELAHLYVARNARGSGVAAELLHDAEQAIATAGFETARLVCAVGNDRAARFYEKHGWERRKTAAFQIDTPMGAMLLDIWHYEKRLAPLSPNGREQAVTRPG